jgi:hypothetical protein
MKTAEFFLKKKRLTIDNFLFSASQTLLKLSAKNKLLTLNGFI